MYLIGVFKAMDYSTYIVPKDLTFFNRSAKAGGIKSVILVDTSITSSVAPQVMNITRGIIDFMNNSILRLECFFKSNVCLRE